MSYTRFITPGISAGAFCGPTYADLTDQTIANTMPGILPAART